MLNKALTGSVVRDLTTEKLRKAFKNNFELAHFAIQMGRFCIRGGESSLAEVLEQICKHPSESYLKDLELLEKENASS